MAIACKTGNIKEHRAKYQQKLIALLISQWALSAVEVYHHCYLLRWPYHDSPYRGKDWVHDLLNGHPDRFYGQFGVHKHVFCHLVAELWSLGMKNSKYLAVEEHVAIFLYSSVTGLSVWLIAERFQHSFETVSMSVFHISQVYCTTNDSSVTSRKYFMRYHHLPSTQNMSTYPSPTHRPQSRYHPIPNIFLFSKMSHTFPVIHLQKSAKHHTTKRVVYLRTA